MYHLFITIQLWQSLASQPSDEANGMRWPTVKNARCLFSWNGTTSGGFKQTLYNIINVNASSPVAGLGDRSALQAANSRYSERGRAE